MVIDGPMVEGSPVSANAGPMDIGSLMIDGDVGVGGSASTLGFGGPVATADPVPTNGPTLGFGHALVGEDVGMGSDGESMGIAAVLVAAQIPIGAATLGSG